MHLFSGASECYIWPKREIMIKEKEEQMMCRIKQWRQSGLTKKDFCIEHRLSYYQFKYWCKQLGYVKKRQPRKTSSDFISLHPVKSSGVDRQSVIEITYPNGVILKISSSTSLNVIQSLIRTT